MATESVSPVYGLVHCGCSPHQYSFGFCISTVAETVTSERRRVPDVENGADSGSSSMEDSIDGRHAQDDSGSDYDTGTGSSSSSSSGNERDDEAEECDSVAAQQRGGISHEHVVSHVDGSSPLEKYLK